MYVNADRNTSTSFPTSTTVCQTVNATPLFRVTLDNASDCRANGLTDY